MNRMDYDELAKQYDLKVLECIALNTGIVEASKTLESLLVMFEQYKMTVETLTSQIVELKSEIDRLKAQKG